jgi:hypothetical protein
MSLFIRAQVRSAPLAASVEFPQPAVGDPIPEHHECSKIRRHCVVIEVAADDMPQPLSPALDRLVHAPSHLLRLRRSRRPLPSPDDPNHLPTCYARYPGGSSEWPR